MKIWYFVLISTLYVVSVFSNDSQRRYIEVAFYEYGYLYNMGVGIDRDIITEVSKRTGYFFEPVVLARARIWSDLKNGKLDMSVSGIQNEERDTFAWFVHYMIIKNYAVLRKADIKNIKNAEDFIVQGHLLFGAVTAFKHGLMQDRWLDILRTQNRVEYSQSADAIFKKIRDGRVNAVFSQPPVYNKYLKDLMMENIVVIQDWTPEENGIKHGLILSKKVFTESDAVFFRKIISDMKNDGTLRRIYLRYLPENIVKKMLDF